MSPQGAIYLRLLPYHDNDIQYQNNIVYYWSYILNLNILEDKMQLSWQYGIKRFVTALPHVRNVRLFFLKMTGMFSFCQMINRRVARFLTSEKDLVCRMKVWAKGPLLVRLLGDPLNGLNDPPTWKNCQERCSSIPPNSVPSVFE